MTLTPGYGFPPGDPGRMLASTADRERALDVLRAGFAEGRLTQEEHDERVGRVYAARTYADLAAVTGDLPGGMPPPIPMYPPAGLQYRPVVPQYPVTAPAYPPVYGSKTNPLATASLWCGIAGVIFGLPSIAAIILGSAAFHQIRRSGETGWGSAAAGLVLGLLGVVLLVVRIVIAMPGS
jgi:hypothetical protein